MSPPRDTVHATCIAIAGRGVLLEGASGTGKSDLALRLIDRGALLVSDDRTILTVDTDRLLASAPPSIAGRIEVRGLGIIDLPVAPHPVRLALWLTLEDDPDRMPPDPLPWRFHGGYRVPLLALSPFEASAPIKVERALHLFGLPA